METQFKDIISLQLAGSPKVTQELSKLSLKQRNDFLADYVRLTKLRGIINEINTN